MNRFVTFELVLGANRIAKLTLSQQKLSEENNLRKLKLTSGRDSKEISS